MGVSKNRGIPKSSILIRFSIIFTIHFGGNTTFFGNIHMWMPAFSPIGIQDYIPPPSRGPDRCNEIVTRDFFFRHFFRLRPFVTDIRRGGWCDQRLPVVGFFILPTIFFLGCFFGVFPGDFPKKNSTDRKLQEICGY